MACSGCVRRRAKIIAAYTAVKQGFVSAKKSYAAQAVNFEQRIPNGSVEVKNVVDIRNQA